MSPSATKHDDLRQRREAVLERLDLRLERRLQSRRRGARRRNRQEPGAVRNGGRPVDEPGEREHPDRVEARRREGELAEHLPLGETADDPERKADAHLEDERLDDDPERRARFRRELDHPDHQRDPNRVVRAGLPLEERPHAAADRAVAENGEHHRRVGRGDRRAEQAAHDPAETERPVAEERDQPGGGERAGRAERATGRATVRKSAQADRRAPVEQDHDQRDRPDPLHRPCRQRERRRGVRSDCCGDEEQRRGGHGDPGAQLAREQRRPRAPPRQKTSSPKLVRSCMPIRTYLGGSDRKLLTFR